MSKLSNNVNQSWFAKTEVFLVATSIGSSAAAIVFQQVAFAAITSIPLSLAISLNSSNRKRLEEVERQHKASIIQLQKVLDKQESTDKVLYSLPNHSNLLEIEKSLEDYNTTFTNRLINLDKRQASVNVKLQQIDSDSQQFTEIQQRFYILESLLRSNNSTLSNNTNLQEILFSVEGKIEKLEKQFNNLPLPSLQYQLKQVQQLVDKLQSSNTESTQVNKYLSEKIQDISQKVQSVNNKTQELSLTHTEIQNQLHSLKAIDVDKIQEEIKLLLFTDFHANNTSSIALNQHLLDEVESLQQKIQAISISVSERIKALQVDIQTQRLFIEKSEHKIHEDLYELADWHKNLEAELKQLIDKNGSTTSSNTEKCDIEVQSKKETQYMCDRCHGNYKHQPIEGGYLFNNKFCRQYCKYQFELKNGLAY